MPASELNAHILDYIFGILYSETRRDSDRLCFCTYRRLLRIGLTCRSWRDCMAKYTCRTIIIERAIMASRGLAEGAMNEGADVVCEDQQLIASAAYPSGPTTLVERTNLEAIAKNKRYIGYCKELKISALYICIDGVDIANILKEHGFSEADWKRITTISISDSSSVHDHANLTNGKHKEAFDYLVQRLPNIRALKYQNYHSKYAMVPQLAIKLAKHYERQLSEVHFHSFRDPRPGSIEFSSQTFSHLSISSRGNWNRLKVYAPALRSLHLYSPRATTWPDIFCASDAHTWFNNLEHLCLEFESMPLRTIASIPRSAAYDLLRIKHRSDTQVEYHFPRLRAAELLNYYYDSVQGEEDSLLSVLYCSPLEQLTINGYKGLLKAVGHSVLSKVYRLEIMESMQGNENESVNSSLPGLFGVPSPRLRSAVLQAVNETPFQTCDKINWQNIQRLELRFNVSSSTAKHVILQLPKLAFIRIDNITKDSSEAHWHRDHVNSRVEEMALFGSVLHVQKPKLVDCLRLLLPLVPSLLRVSVPSQLVEEARQCIAATHLLPELVQAVPLKN